MALIKTEAYTDEFFDKQVWGSLESARVVVPILLKYIQPSSVIDVGCGRGAWLLALRENGVRRTTGLDGKHVDTSMLLIEQGDFVTADLTRPLSIKDRYDLAICLEVAEHLPSTCARQLVRSLTGLSTLVLFSAAIPGQGGFLHVNEQWPPYWTRLFQEQGFVRLDPIRPRIWQNTRVEWWYRQNIFLYASNSEIRRSPSLLAEAALAAQEDIELIHSSIVGRRESLPGVLSDLPRAVRSALARRFPSFLNRP
jgi:SAM-dependent methyltransferase